MRQEVHVFKRKSTSAIHHEINSNKEALEKARKYVASLEAQKKSCAEHDAPSTSFIWLFFYFIYKIIIICWINKNFWSCWLFYVFGI